MSNGEVEHNRTDPEMSEGPAIESNAPEATQDSVQRAAASAETSRVTPALRVLRIVPGYPGSAASARGAFADDSHEPEMRLSPATADTHDRSGWWLASDGEWYPPEQSPNYTDHPNTYDESEQTVAPQGEREADTKSAMTSAENPPAAWYDDPLTVGMRYWDGTSWTQHVAYRRYRSELSGTQAGDGGEATGVVDDRRLGRHDEAPHQQTGSLELPGWWFTPGDE